MIWSSISEEYQKWYLDNLAVHVACNVLAVAWGRMCVGLYLPGSARSNCQVHRQFKLNSYHVGPSIISTLSSLPVRCVVKLPFSETLPNPRPSVNTDSLQIWH